MEHQKHQARILGLQRAKQEAEARAAQERGALAEMTEEVKHLKEERERSAVSLMCTARCSASWSVIPHYMNKTQKVGTTGTHVALAMRHRADICRLQEAAKTRGMRVTQLKATREELSQALLDISGERDAQARLLAVARAQADEAQRRLAAADRDAQAAEHSRDRALLSARHAPTP